MILQVLLSLLINQRFSAFPMKSHVQIAKVSVALINLTMLMKLIIASVQMMRILAYRQ